MRSPALAVLTATDPDNHPDDAATLTTFFQGLAEQELHADDEVCVALAVGSATTPEKVTALAHGVLPGVKVQAVCATRPGRGAAINAAVAATTAPVLLFLAVDFRALPGLASEHRRLHAGSQDTIIGVGPAPFDEPDEMQQWLDRRGMASGWALHGQRVREPTMFSYGNSSIPRRRFSTLGGFSEAYPLAGAEDLEFALHAHEAGFAVRPLPGARAIHVHDVSLRDRARQARMAGSVLSILCQRMGTPPAAHGIPPGPRLRWLGSSMFWTLLHVLTRRPEHREHAWRSFLRLNMLQGYMRGYRAVGGFSGLPPRAPHARRHA